MRKLLLGLAVVTTAVAISGNALAADPPKVRVSTEPTPAAVNYYRQQLLREQQVQAQMKQQYQARVLAMQQAQAQAQAMQLGCGLGPRV